MEKNAIIKAVIAHENKNKNLTVFAEAELEAHWKEIWARAQISEREYQVLHYYYREGLSFEKIADIYGFSRTRAAQIRDKALRKLHLSAKIVLVLGNVEKNEDKVKAHRQKTIYSLPLDAKCFNTLYRGLIHFLYQEGALPEDEDSVSYVGRMSLSEIVEAVPSLEFHRCGTKTKAAIIAAFEKEGYEVSKKWK